MSSADNGDDDYVGYGHPPKKHRFKKGNSGNPQGRPKKSNQGVIQQFYDDCRNVLSGHVSARGADGTLKKMRATEACARKCLHTAMSKGDLRTVVAGMSMLADLAAKEATVPDTVKIIVEGGLPRFPRHETTISGTEARRWLKRSKK